MKEGTYAQEIETLIRTAAIDYANWCERAGRDQDFEDTVSDFERQCDVVEGRKYTKIVHNRSVWGFVVATDYDSKFHRGDILKAASYNAPARNAARGNIFEDYVVNWTGPLYL